MTRPQIDPATLQAMAESAGLDLSLARCRDLSRSAKGLFRLSNRLMQALPEEVPPGEWFSATPLHQHDQ